MSTFDVIIIGAGPGGSAAAYLLANAGMRVALVDKAIFPRHKLCGGLLSERTEKVYKSIFGNGWQECYEFTSSDAAFFYNKQLLNEFKGSRRMYFTMRSSFDHHLIKLAAAKGATLLENTRAVFLDPGNRSVCLSDGTSIRGNFVIGADGVFSMVARNLGFSMQKKNLAAGLEIEFPRQGHIADLIRPEIHLGVIRWGYGWVFPKRDTLTIGIAGLAHKNSDLRSSFRVFLERICSKAPNIKWIGYPIPFCSFSLRPGVGSTLLVGDAAGFVEPVTGEGIAFAMQSGGYAARAILEAATRGEPQSALKCYQARYQGLARHLMHAKWMSYLLFPVITQRLFCRALRRSDSVVSQFMDLASDEKNYGDYSKFLAKKIMLYFLKMPARLCCGDYQRNQDL
jgi:geranylgeranyl reductase family protein